MPDPQLPLSNVITVSINGAPTELPLPNVNTAALFSSETPDPTFVTKKYYQPSAGAADFGSDSKAYRIAKAFFAQQPNPLATRGYLVIIPLLEAEDVEDAITRTKDLVFYFGILVDGDITDDADLLSLAGAVQGLDKMLFYASLNPADFADAAIFDDIVEAGDTHTRLIYYDNGTADDTPAFAAAYCARLLSVNFAGSSTASTMQFKTMATFVADDTVDQAARDQCLEVGVDVYPNVGGVASLLTSGVNLFSDSVYARLWFKFALQLAGFNYLRSTSTKIPQTEVGLEGLKNILRGVCERGVQNGFLAPGAWNSPDTFGNSADLIRCVANIGYYVWSEPISDQDQADRDARIAPVIQIAIKEAGAIHSADIIVQVNL